MPIRQLPAESVEPDRNVVVVLPDDPHAVAVPAEQRHQRGAERVRPSTWETGPNHLQYVCLQCVDELSVGSGLSTEAGEIALIRSLTKLAT